MAGRYNRTNYSSYLSDEPMPDATSEKEQGNEYFKQKKFAEAIECYSRSIALSPTAVAFANRAMAYLKLRRFEEAENDCTEALNLDDRYVKAYSRRITARKGLGKLKEAMDDAEFAVSVDANNPELRKQYSEIKALLMEKMAKRSSVQAKHTISEFDKAGDRKDITSHPPSEPQKVGCSVLLHDMLRVFPLIRSKVVKDRPGAVVKYSPLVPSVPGFDAASLHFTVQG